MVTTTLLLFIPRLPKFRNSFPLVLASLSIRCISTLISSPSNFLPGKGHQGSQGCRHQAHFKPGSIDGIRQVISIAAANPDFPIVMQWTSGRAGGHHSFEDFHQPVLTTYRAIRQHANISLVGGLGFGSAEDVWEYLTGDWSVQRFGVQPMPFGSETSRRCCKNFRRWMILCPSLRRSSRSIHWQRSSCSQQEDMAYFLAISQRLGQKPVPFIPVLDASFEVWFKKVCSSTLLMLLFPSKFANRRKLYVGFALGGRRYQRGVRSGSSTCVHFARPRCSKMVHRKG